MWAIWTSRNNWTHDRGAYDPIQALKMVKEALTILNLPKGDTRLLPGHGWRPPEADTVKINTDGGIAIHTRTGGAGGVARARDVYLGAWSKPYPGITDPLVAEALALRDGVIFARLRGYKSVIMEVDCLEMVNLWNSRHGARSTVTPILLELGELAHRFSSFVIQHVPRTANLPAHLCAKFACTLMVTSSWLDFIPDFLTVSLMADQAGSVIVE
jgi:ribonuclease HI